MSDTQTTETSNPLEEIRSTRETAQKIANERPTEGADVTRVLAGLIAHLAEQMEKLAMGSSAALTPSATHRGETSEDQAADATQQEEDASRQGAPAAPAWDPNAELE